MFLLRLHATVLQKLLPSVETKDETNKKLQYTNRAMEWGDQL